MPLRVLPNIEALLADWLGTHEDIVALDARVANVTPDKTVRPWIRVTRLNAIDRGARHLITYPLQFDCVAGRAATDARRGQREAHAVAAATRAVLEALQGTVRDDVVIARVLVVGDTRAPDTTLEPARERYILTVEITAHATV